MARFFEMPQASPTMESGVLLSWKKNEGDKLVPGDAVAEVETDKAAMDIEVFDNAYLLKILVPAGEDVPAGQPIAILGTKPDEDISALVAEFAAKKAVPAPTQAPAKAEVAQAAPVEAEQAAPVDAAPVVTPVQAPVTPAAPSKPGLAPTTWMGHDVDAAILEAEVLWSPAVARTRASPAARKAAREAGIELDRLHGTGPRGRVTRADVEKAASQPTASQPASSAGPATAGRADTSVRNSQMRKTIARRLSEVWRDAPVFYLTANFDCDNLVNFRSQLKAAGAGATYNILLIKAVARALVDVPEVNASWGADAITRHGGVHIGVAVALPDGLITPVVRDADLKTLGVLTTEVGDLTERARNLKLKPEEYVGSTFTISNLGMMEIEAFTAIINPPEAAILAVGAMKQEPVVKNGQLGVGWRMRVTMTCDHRVVDGALGARFLQQLRKYVEQPALLAV